MVYLMLCLGFDMCAMYGFRDGAIIFNYDKSFRYSSGPKIKPADLQIHEVYRKYTSDPVFVILDVNSNKDLSLLASDTSTQIMEAYYAVQEKTHEESFSRTFRTLKATFGADEAEDVGVEHLLRDIRNRSTSTLANRVSAKADSLRTMISKLEEMKAYLGMVRSGKYPYNAKIVSVIQEIFNQLPETVKDSVGGLSNEDVSSSGALLSRRNSQDKAGSPLDRQSSTGWSTGGGNERREELVDPEQAKYISQEMNDQFLGLYVGATLRSILTLHDLVNNKLAAQDFVKELEKEEKEASAGATTAVK